MPKNLKKEEIERIKELIKPVKENFHPKDILQIIVGAAILAIPVGYTEETWHLGDILPLTNIMIFMLLSILFIAMFIYFNHYKHSVKIDINHFIKRTITTYVVSFLVVALTLSLIQKAPWTLDFLLAFKRTVIVTFPCSLSAVVVDVIK